MFYLLIILLHIIAVPEVISSINSLSGPQCPGTVVFTCNALDFGSQIINWYINNTNVAKYTFSQHDVFPVNITSSISVLKASISSAYIQNSRFNYKNFILFANLEDLLPFQGQILTCGTVAQKSNYFQIENYDIQGEYNHE